MSQKLFRALARPLKFDLALGPVISRLEKGAELDRATPFGAPRLSSERRWISNQAGGLPGSVQDTVLVFSARAQPWLRGMKPAPVIRLDHPPPLLSGCSRQESLHLEDAFPGENQIDGPAELGRENRQRLALAVLPGESPQMLLAFWVVAKKQGGRFGEGPLEMGVADLGASDPQLFAGGAVFTLHESRIRQEILDALEAMDVVDLVEDRLRQDLADARNRPEPVIRLGIVLLGSSLEMEFELSDRGVVVFDEVEVDLHVLADIGIGKRLGDADSVRLVGELGRGRFEVVLVMGVLDMSQKVGATPHEMETPPKQIPRGSHLGRIDIGLGEVPAAKEGCDLEGIDFVVLGLAAVDGVHVEGVSEDELDALLMAQVREPVPGEDALDGDDEVVSVGLDGRKKVFWAASHVLVEKDLAVAIENAEVHGLGVKIDAAVVSMSLCVESHGSPLGW